MLVQIKLTVHDYYDYVGTQPTYSNTKRVLGSLPYPLNSKEVIKILKLKYKILKRPYMHYRVTLLVEVNNTDRVAKIPEDYKDYMHQPSNYSYKILQDKESKGACVID